jgi:indole-3-glycerol phosphate synthase
MILKQLADYAIYRVKLDMQKISLDEMKTKALSLPSGNYIFEKALRKGKPAIISEVKKASPSKGIIAKDFPYIEIAKEYETAGTDCISALTEPKWFLGSNEIFCEIRKKVSVPMIRKDFTVSEYQIYQAKVMGADAVLLICALLDTKTINKYLEICDMLGISALVEAHTAEEIKSAISAGARIIGVNNRNLKDFTVSLDNASNLRDMVPSDRIFVAESGISTPQDAIELIKNGADALLIGEALMRSNDKIGFIKQIKDGVSYDKN